jgi:hypothetical protein
MALLTKLNCLGLLVLKGRFHDKVRLCEILWLPLYRYYVVVCYNILQIRETGFTPRAPPV